MNPNFTTEKLLLELGRAVYVFQAIEARIKMILPHLSVPTRGEPPRDEGWDGRFKYLESKEMLGNLVRLLQERLHVDEPQRLEAHWREVVQCRNDVIHNFVLQPFAGCATSEDLCRSIEYLRIRRTQALPMLRMLDTLLRVFVAALELPEGYEGEFTVELPEWVNESAA